MLTISRTNSHRVSLKQASEAIKHHRSLAAQPRKFHGGAVAKSQLFDLLNQPNCEWLRVYRALDAYGWPTLVLAGADEAAADLQDVMLEFLFPCPPFCDPGSALFPVEDAQRTGPQGVSLAGRSRNHRIAVADATRMIERHRAAARDEAGSIHSGLVMSHEVREVLEQDGCEWLRIYLARDAQGTESFVLVGADAGGADLAEGAILEAVAVAC